MRGRPGKYVSYVKDGTTYKGIAYDDEQRFANRDEIAIRLIDENFKPVMSKIDPTKQALVFKNVTGVKLIGYAD